MSKSKFQMNAKVQIRRSNICLALLDRKFGVDLKFGP